MAYERPGDAIPVTADYDCRHGDLIAADGHVGRAIKTQTPAQDTLRADRNKILTGEACNLRPRGVGEVDNTNLAGIAKGALVYITTATGVISNAAGGGKVVLGKVTHLPGEQGTPTNRVRVDLEQKV